MKVINCNFRIYISCPISIHEVTLQMYVKAAEKLGTKVDYWKRDTPYREHDNIAACDAFVLVLPSEEFKHSIERLPAGCKKELMLAQRYSKNIYIAYRPMTGIPGFYDTSISSTVISGIGGSSRMLANTIAAYKGTEIHRNFYEDVTDISFNPCSEVIHESSISSSIKSILINVPRL